MELGHPIRPPHHPSTKEKASEAAANPGKSSPILHTPKSKQNPESFTKRFSEDGLKTLIEMLFLDKVSSFDPATQLIHNSMEAQNFGKNKAFHYSYHR
ncbi:hypothetical protein RHGRI_013182 [Rhododendron griersonianum]|uniref:Uncharacterized protein n=1 Tax=Rhododendron griersonianum TaxID=479676 RepID=A0AAV6K514_9ERIC|nr:hypothetical protein RHGRI_013182 [Rhododendron griersonianum]